MIGRDKEVAQLNKIIRKKKSSFLAVTGRRRVGKTYIIDEFFKKEICFRVTGIQNAPMDQQIRNFMDRLVHLSQKTIITQPKDWQEVFFHFRSYLEKLDKESKKIIFIDELPWMATARSGFSQLLAHLWNDYLSKQNHFVLVICGSASSWITEKIVNDKGGLHNRLTDLINLSPFSLKETKEFFLSLGIKLNHQEISKLYMTFGGIPYYLEQINRGESAAVAIERICFAKEGVLKNEYNNLYKALFNSPSNHEAVVEALAKKMSGLNRTELIKQSKVKAGGTFNRTINELLSSGFIAEFTPFGKKKRGALYRLTDEYSIFYHRFMKKNKKYVKGQWMQISASQAYKIWTGYAFENLCMSQIEKLKQAMGIGAIYTEVSTFRILGNKKQKGFQIDLIIDRRDNVINLCEMKYYDAPFKINKKYAEQLLERKALFIENTGTRKQVFNTMITNHELQENEHSISIIDTQVTLRELF